MFRISWICLIAVLPGLMPQVVEADLIITIPDTTIVAGSSASLDVTISASSTSELMKAYNFTFRLTPLSASSQLRFIDPQINSQLGNASYVFHGDSDAELDATGYSTVSTDSGFNDTLIASDVTDTTNPATVTVSGKLLAVLDLLHFSPGDPESNVGDTFQVSLLNASTFISGSNSTIPYTSTVGTITVTSAAAVPEPSTWGGILSLFAFFGYRRLKQRTGGRINSDIRENA